MMLLLHGISLAEPSLFFDKLRMSACRAACATSALVRIESATLVAHATCGTPIARAERDDLLAHHALIESAA